MEAVDCQQKPDLGSNLGEVIEVEKGTSPKICIGNLFYK